MYNFKVEMLTDGNLNSVKWVIAGAHSVTETKPIRLNLPSMQHVRVLPKSLSELHT